MKIEMEISNNEAKLLLGATKAIRLDMEMNEMTTYFDDDNPDYEKNGEDWEVADDYESRNGTKIIRLLRKALLSAGADKELNMYIL